MKYFVTENSRMPGLYGIVLCRDGKKEKEIPGITGSRADIEELARTLNGLDIEPCHFEDIIEDYLTDFRI